MTVFTKKAHTTALYIGLYRLYFEISTSLV